MDSTTFHKLPNGEYGLREWYPNLRESKAKAVEETADAAQDEAAAHAGAAFDFKAKEEADAAKATA